MSLKPDSRKRTRKSKPKAKDKFAPFRGKTTLTEGEVNLMKTRLNRGDISRNQMRDNGYALTDSQTEKALKWLRPRAKKPSAWEEGFGHRERMALGWSDGYVVGQPANQYGPMKGTKIRLVDFYQQFNPYTGEVIFNYPVYSVSRKVTRRESGKTYTKVYSFDYYVRGGKVHITG